MAETQPRPSSERSVLVAWPSISRNPDRAAALIILLHGPLDLLTAYWMMSVRGAGVEWNPIASAVFGQGPLAYAAFTAIASVVLGGLIWMWRGSLWENRWTPAIAEVLIIIGMFGLVGANTLAALGLAF